MNAPVETVKILRAASGASVFMASALVAFGGAPLRVGAQEEEVRVGDFVVLKSVDFLTDAVTYEWARSGDPRPTLEDIVGSIGVGRPGYDTLDLTCREDGLLIRIYYEPARSGGVGGTSRPARASDEDRPPRRPVPVQMRFDSDELWSPSDWTPGLAGANVTMPQALVEPFLASARPATRLRVRVGPAMSGDGFGDNVLHSAEVEFSLMGITRAVELLGCGGGA